jgi:hypothetical protein
MKVRRSERPFDPADHRQRLNERLRAEYIAGAEEEGRKRIGRPMTALEVERVLRRYPGDVERPARPRGTDLMEPGGYL